MNLKEKIINFLRWSQKYTKTDMVYVAKSGFWFMAGKIGVLLISLLTMTVFANWLSKESFGVYQYVISMVGIFAILSLPGINTSLIRSVAKKLEGSLIDAFRTKLKWGLLGSFALLILAGWYLLNQNYILGASFLLGALFFPLKHAAPIFASYWNGKKRFDVRAKYELCSTFLSAIVVISTIYLTNNVICIILAFFASHAIFDYLFYKLTEKKIENKEKDINATPYGKSLTLMTGIAQVAEHIDKVILWKFLGPVQVAVYSFAQTPIKKIWDAIPVSVLALPKLSEKSVKERKSGILAKFWKLFLMAIPVTLGAIILAPIVYKLILPQYTESVIYFQVMSLFLLATPFSILGTSLLAEMKKKELYIINILSPSLKIILLFVLIPLFNVWGAVIALLLGQLINSILVFYFFLKI